MSMINKEFSKMNYEAAKNHDNSKKISGKYGIEAEKSFNTHLKNINDSRNFSPRLFDKGIEYFNVGGDIDSLPAELKDNDSFMKGYEHAKRLSHIENVGSMKGR